MTTAEKLRAIATWYEAHPDAPEPDIFSIDKRLNCQMRYGISVGRALKSIGHCTKEYNLEYRFVNFKVPIEEAGITLEFYVNRDRVCTRKVVGTRIIPAKVIPERVEPEHEEEIVEWDCSGSLLQEQT